MPLKMRSQMLVVLTLTIANLTSLLTVPDFYGEKISSVAGYRQWLKDQRAFNKKRTSFV